MYLLIAANGQLSLEDGDNMRAFSIVEQDSGLAATCLSAIATPAEEQHYWLDADAVVELSGRKGDQQWVKVQIIPTNLLQQRNALRRIIWIGCKGNSIQQRMMCAENGIGDFYHTT